MSQLWVNDFTCRIVEMQLWLHIQRSCSQDMSRVCIVAADGALLFLRSNGKIA